MLTQLTNVSSIFPLFKITETALAMPTTNEAVTIGPHPFMNFLAISFILNPDKIPATTPMPRKYDPILFAFHPNLIVIPTHIMTPIKNVPTTIVCLCVRKFCVILSLVFPRVSFSEDKSIPDP